MILIVLLKICAINSIDLSNNVVEITYIAATRGSKYECTITKKEIVIIESGVNRSTKSKILTNDQWHELISILHALKIESLQNLKAPSSKFVLDRSRIANVIIKTTKENYESVSFDENNPPKELKLLINKILSIAQTVD